MAAAMSSSCYASSLRLIPFRRTFFSSQPKSLILPLKPSQFPSFRRATITFQKIPTGIVPPLSASSSDNNLQPIEELPPKLQEIVKLFQSVQDSKAKYEQLLFYGKNLKPLDSQFKTTENKVQGCVSQVWVRAFFDEQRNVVYEADSDSVLTKGLAALLVQGLSGSPVPDILRVTPDFALLLGTQQSLSPSRNNGLLNMLKLMQKKALHLELKAEDEDEEDTSSVKDLGTEEITDSVSLGTEEEDTSPEDISEPKVLDSESSLVEDLGTEEITTDSDSVGPRGMRIREKLEKELNPVELLVEDVSYQHAGHAGSSEDGETHFNLRIVSDAFRDKSLVKRHRIVYDLLREELNSGLHALSIVAKTPAEV